MHEGEEGQAMGERDSSRRWHIDKGIPIAVIVTVIILAVSVSQDQARQDERISLTESSIQTLQEARLRDQSRTEKKFDELKSDLRRINEKLDRLIEGQPGGH